MKGYANIRVWARSRPVLQAGGVLLIAVVVALSLTSSPPVPGGWEGSDKLGHLLAYAVLMGYHAWAYPRRWARLGWAVALVSLGVLLEVLQGLGGVRVFEVADMLANAAGVGLGGLLYAAGRAVPRSVVGRPGV